MRMDYLALADGLNTRKLVPANENILSIVKKNPTRDYYTSLFRYKDHHYEQFKKTASLAGIKDVKTKNLVFDFDDENNPSNAKADTLQLCNRLLDAGINEDAIQLYFSGNKGFNVAVNLNEELSRQEFVNIVFGLASDLKTFDVRINDEQRIIRVPFSKHPKSKLHKIPLVMEELATLPVGAIKELAKDLEGYDLSEFVEPEAISLTKSLNVLKTTMFKKVGVAELEDIKGFDENDLDFSQCPKWLAPERFALQEGYFYGSESVSKGERNIAFMILASTFRNQGFSAEHTQALLEVTAEKQAKRTGEDPYTPEQLQREVINAVFSNSWKGGIYSSDEEILQITRKRFGIDEPSIEIESVGIDDVGGGFIDFAKNIDKNRIFTGLESLDKQLVLTSGMLVALLAAPGAGKTSFANSFVETVNRNNENTLFFSLDMYKNLLFNRLLQKYSGYPFEKILNMYRDDEQDEVILNAYSQVVQNYSKVAFNFKSGINIDELELEVKKYTEKIGKSPKLVVVDYLEKIRSVYADSTASTSYVAGRLSDIAKKYDTTVLLLVQPSKMGGGDPRDEFKNYRAIKGSSSIESESRVILGMHRPGYDPTDSYRDKYASISILKNNTGGLGRLDYFWDGISGTLSELDREGRNDLKKLRDELENIKAQLDDGF